MQISSKHGTFRLKGLPDSCPYCHNLITPTPLYGNKNNEFYEVFMECPNVDCKHGFISYYSFNKKPNTETTEITFENHTSFGTNISKVFSAIISSSYPSFVTIYNQAFTAEQQGLLEICGVGYRKALEFLIKDYCIELNPGKTEVIEKKLLGQVINEFVNEERIKSVAKRAVWLGNDETHYIRKWEGKNLNDLKKLIDLTVHWIEMEKLTQSFQEDMPD